MKITINLNNAETNAIEKVTNKYAPVESDYIKIENATENYKFGNSEIKRTTEGTDINVELKGDFVIEVIKFIDDIAAPVINAAKSLKFLFEGAKERFSKWAEDEEDVWQKIAKHLAETNPGEPKITGLIMKEEWVQIDERTKKLDKIWSHYPIQSEEDLASCLKEAGTNEVRFVKTGHGDAHLESSISQVAKWVGDLYGTSYEGKHVAE